jgi:hypothetical protein
VVVNHSGEGDGDGDGDGDMDGIGGGGMGTSGVGGGAGFLNFHPNRGARMLRTTIANTPTTSKLENEKICQ